MVNMFTVSLLDGRILEQFKKVVEKKVGRRKASQVIQKLMQGYIDGKFHVKVD